MAQLRHGSAHPTPAVRRTTQRNQASLPTLVQRHGLDSKTMVKRRRRATTQDAGMGPTPASAVLTVAKEAIAVAFRLPTLRPLDDCLYALQATIPHLSRLALHRRFQR